MFPDDVSLRASPRRTCGSAPARSELERGNRAKLASARSLGGSTRAAGGWVPLGPRGAATLSGWWGGAHGCPPPRASLARNSRHTQPSQTTAQPNQVAPAQPDRGEMPRKPNPTKGVRRSPPREKPKFGGPFFFTRLAGRDGCAVTRACWRLKIVSVPLILMRAPPRWARCFHSRAREACPGGCSRGRCCGRRTPRPVRNSASMLQPTMPQHRAAQA